MIPRLTLSENPQPLYETYLAALRRQGFEGETRTDFGTRVLAGTDNSIYQITPQAVVFPKHEEKAFRDDYDGHL